MRPSLLLLPLLAAGCAASQSHEPSLAPRAAEAIDPRIPIPVDPVAGPVDATLAARLAELLAQVRQGHAAFDAAASETASLAAAAGAAQTDSWVEAQQSLSALIAARAPVTQAVADIDALTAARLIAAGGVASGDLAAIQVASSEANAINQSEAETIDRLQAQLAR
jgi:hypothetical protein